MPKRKEHFEHLPHAEAADRTIRLRQHRNLFALLSIAAGLIFLQGYMIAPLIPRLAEVFNVPVQEIGFIVPAYMLSYALMALFYGVLSDRFGRWSVIRISLFIFVICTALTATAQTASQMATWRLLTGIGASGVIPLTFALIGDLFPFDQRGSKLGLVFAAMEGGMAAGSAGGAILEPFVGWRSLFLGTAVLAALVLWRMAALAGIVMIFEIPPYVTTIAVLVLSLGYDLTQPLFVGIVTDLGDGNNLGQTMGLKVFTLFTGFGVGSLIFGELLHFGFGLSLAIFGGIQLITGLIAIPLFWQEVPSRLRSGKI
ncbi:MAG: MFS transporter [Chlorogloeopsis fritschii C42_A2020_084]|uniref:MFS transporter n=1 Tax=Chlorogloeopsis fritschii TaxID=1124 RepID=UPI0019DBC203|nr:MFS transporter [Chlorogloeopsis fritschii]MBF2007059.1 MFS transporter [Chlorogloeopsis fritschii C42_A2020_084]